MNGKTARIAMVILGLVIAGTLAGVAITRSPAQAPEPHSEVIETEYGVLTLAYENDKTRLTGTLARSTPCVEWTGEVRGTEDEPPSRVEFSLTSRNTSEVCIQSFGAPYEVSLESAAGAETAYTVRVNDTTAFSGTIGK